MIRPLPTVAIPKALDSSHLNATTFRGMFNLLSFIHFKISNPATTPTTPSYLPPLITESK